MRRDAVRRDGRAVRRADVASPSPKKKRGPTQVPASLARCCSDTMSALPCFCTITLDSFNGTNNMQEVQGKAMKLRTTLGALNEKLSGRKFLTGDKASAADIAALTQVWMDGCPPCRRGLFLLSSRAVTADPLSSLVVTRCGVLLRSSWTSSSLCRRWVGRCTRTSVGGWATPTRPSRRSPPPPRSLASWLKRSTPRLPPCGLQQCRVPA